MRAILPLFAALGLCIGGLASAQAPGPKLSFPIACEIGRTCEVQHYVDRDPGPAASDYRCGPHTYDKHNGVDIRLPDMRAQARGVEVLAAAAGRVARLRDGVQDISVKAPGAPPVNGQDCGNGVVVDHGNGWETQYCHMARGSLKVKVGDAVTAGQPIGRVGLSGNTEYPHLHVTVRHAGQVVDPFAPAQATGCAAQTGLWTPAAAQRMGYKRGAILNAGFAGAPVTMEAIEAGGIAAPAAASQALLAYVRVIGLEAGDQVETVLTGPDGVELAKARTDPYPRWRAQQMQYVGKRRPAGGWTAGEYRAVTRILRAGKPVAERRFAMRL